MAEKDEKKDAISVSSLGHSLSANVAASEVILSVAQELSARGEATQDQEQREMFMRWSDQLADAVITVTSSSGAAALGIGSLFTITEDEPEK